MPIDIKIDSAEFINIEQRIRDRANIVLASSDLKAEVGDFAVEAIKYKARVGKPYNSGGSFPDLADATVKQRRYLAKYNTPHATYGEDFSNLTLTGEFLESLAWLDEGDTLLSIAFTGMHSVYKGAKGQRISKTIMNDTLAQYLAAKGFRVFDMSLDINAQFVKRIKTICLRYIRRGLRISNQVADYDSGG
jgi:hypothetical protein